MIDSLLAGARFDTPGAEEFAAAALLAASPSTSAATDEAKPGAPNLSGTRLAIPGNAPLLSPIAV